LMNEEMDAETLILQCYWCGHELPIREDFCPHCGKASCPAVDVGGLMAAGYGPDFARKLQAAIIRCAEAYEGGFYAYRRKKVMPCP
jgi:hypothetical protein